MENQLALIDLSKKIVLYKEQYVMLDADVAEIYGVQTREINQAVKNNPAKFPEGYIIYPDKAEAEILKSKFLMSNTATTRGGSRWFPKLFTERGLYMYFIIGKIKHSVKRHRKDGHDEVEQG